MEHRVPEAFRNVVMTDIYESEIYVSLEKEDTYTRDYEQSTARANFLLYEDEIMNLTFLNSVLIRSVIINRNLGKRDMFRGVNFSSILPYLNHALEFLDKREAEESALISKYIELPHEWQLELSDWKMKHDVHTITDYQAKRFAKYMKEK